MRELGELKKFFVSPMAHVGETIAAADSHIFCIHFILLVWSLRPQIMLTFLLNIIMH